MNIFAVLKGLAVFGALVLAGFVIRVTELDIIFTEAWIDGDIRGSGLTGEMLFVTVCVLGTALGLPRQIVSFLSGYAFGFFLGTVLALLSTTIGCIVAFSYARLFGQNFVRKKFNKKIEKIDTFLRKNPFAMTLLIRFLPVGNNLVTCLTAGVSSVSAFPFVFGSMIGFIPQTAIFSLAGSGVTVDQFYIIAISATLFLFSACLGLYLYRKFNKDNKIGGTTGNQSELKK